MRCIEAVLASRVRGLSGNLEGCGHLVYSYGPAPPISQRKQVRGMNKYQSDLFSEKNLHFILIFISFNYR
jgi:hypothetical protein